MTKKSLQAWCNNGDINYSQKEIINKFGVNDYSPEYALVDLRKLWYLDEIFERNKKSGELWIYGKIQKMIFFSTSWNNNLIIVISGNNSYSVWLLVYEMPSRQMDEILEKFQIFQDYSALSSAEQKVYELEKVLKGDNPITYFWLPKLEIVHNGNYYNNNYPSVFTNGQVKRIELPYNSAKSDPDSYIKPLDIVKICIWDSNRNKDMVHACIYLGNRQICHVFAGEGWSGNREDQVKIQDWEKFFKVLPGTNKMLRYHPIIAFKTPEKVIEHIAKCIEGKAKYFAIKNKILIQDTELSRVNNCEHFVNRCVLGLNFSELAERRVGRESKTFFVPSVGIAETNGALDNLTSYPTNKINEIKGYKAYHPQGIPMEGRIEVQPKSWYELKR